MSSIALRRLIFTIFATSLFLLLPSSCSAYRFINPRNNIPLVYSNQPTIYAQQSNFPKPIPWNTFVALYSKFNKEKEDVCDCKEKASGERPVEVFLNPDCTDQNLNEKFIKCAQLKGIYCEFNEKCYTRAIRGHNYFSARHLCQSYNKPGGVTSTLLKEEDLTPDIIQFCLPLYTSYFDVEFWHHDDNITEESVKCPSLEIEFQAQSWMVSPSYCGTSDYAVCQITFE
ncbi:UNVERIFIED_CONTAM: hypothetical protein RMT77_015459 [Armadillidium vulgare]